MYSIDGFEHIESSDYRHVATGLMFTLIDGGEFDFGMSADEEALLRTHASGDEEDGIYGDFLCESLRFARPIKHVRLSPFLIANYPLTVSFVENRCGIESKLGLADDHAAYFSSANDVLLLLDELGLRLPSETEWEFCHRRFTPHGMPGEDALVFAATETAGGFGSYCELVADVWNPDLSSTPNDGRPCLGKGRRVVRGGAETDYPWQGYGEWLRLMPFFRYCEYDDDLLSARAAATVA